jgi:hypothetical protein
MKIEKLVRVTAKSECMDIETVIPSKKATAYVKRLKKIQDEWIDSVSIKQMVAYTPKYKWWIKKKKEIKIVPEGINSRFEIRIEPAGEILI